MASTDSEIETITAPIFEGVWLHNPEDAVASIQQFFFSPSGRQEELNVASEMLSFAGRAKPLAEFGESETDSLKVSLTIPFGMEWGALLEELRAVYLSYRTYVYRDGRGRVWYGVIRALQLTDAREGTRAEFMFEKVDYDVTPVALTTLSEEE